MTIIVRLPCRYIGYFCSLTSLLPPSAPNIRVIFGSKICITYPLTLLLSPKVRYFHCPSIATENKAHTSIPSISWLLPPASMFLARLIIPLMFHNARFLCPIASTQDMDSKKRKKNKIVRRTLPTFLLDMIPIFCLLFYFPSLLNRIVEKKQKKKLIPLIHIRFWYWKGIEKKR